MDPSKILPGAPTTSDPVTWIAMFLVGALILDKVWWQFRTVPAMQLAWTAALHELTVEVRNIREAAIAAGVFTRLKGDKRED